MAGTNLNLKIISNNVRGLNDTKKRQQYFHWLRKNHVEIACIQETFCSKAYEKTFNYTWEGEIYHCFFGFLSQQRSMCYLKTLLFVIYAPRITR